MTRPIYEKEDDARAEEEIIKIFADAIECDAIRPSRKMSEFDFILTEHDTRDVIGVAEVKARTYKWDDMKRMGGVMIDHEKWAMLMIFAMAGLTAWLVVRDCRGEVRWTPVPCRIPPEFKLTGRTDRGDPQDIGIKAVIPIDNFEGVESDKIFVMTRGE